MTAESHQDHQREFAEVFAKKAKTTEIDDDFIDPVTAEIDDAASAEDLDAARRRLLRNEGFFASHSTRAALVLLYLAALASAIFLIIPLPASRALAHVFGQGEIFAAIPASSHRDEPSDAATRLLLHGDRQAGSQSAQWHALWMSEPDNPAWFSRYVAMRLSEDGTLAPELLDEASRIDPENGFWHLVAACVDAEDVIERRSIQESDDGIKKSGWFATDEAGVLRRIELIHQAAAMPRFDSRHLEWLQTAIPHLPHTQNIPQKIHTVAWLAGEILYGGVHLRNLANLQVAAVGIAVEREDPQMAAAIIRNWHSINISLVKNANTLVEVLISYANIKQSVESLHQAAQTLNLSDKAALLASIVEGLEKAEMHAEMITQDGSRDDDDTLIHLKSSMLGGLVLGIAPRMLIDRPESPSESELRPIRRMEHLVFERMMVPPIALITSLSLIGFGALWLSAGKMRRKFAGRSLLLLPGWKLAVFGLLAGAGPLLWYLCMTRLTPFSWHEWSLFHSMQTLFVQWASLVFLILFLPGLIATILIQGECKVFAWRWPGGIKMRLVATICILTALPASGVILFNADQTESLLDLVWWLSIGSMVFVALAMIWSWWGQRKNPIVKSPRRMAAGLFAAHARMLALTLLTGWVFFTQFEEKTWAGQDTLFVINPESPALSSYESEVQLRLRAQVLDMLGPAWRE